MVSRGRTLGRLRVIDQLARRSDGFSLSVGSKSTKLADVNVDPNKGARPDIVATVFHLPFGPELFDTILFTDVLQYLPVNTESLAFSEMKRCLKRSGHLVLSVPNAIGVFTLLDPDRWLLGNHPYTVEKISRIIVGNGWRIEHLTVSGGIWEAIGLLIYYLIEYPLSRILRREVPGPLGLSEMADTQYNRMSGSGYTIFMVCSRKRDIFL
ncbi:class I SAM-dependent methyltransferase [Candidatus Bathyarchaeota archaeon]|nr:MAG: class I SAM-dependent methyltransferase [Candidatus Bathyarchaeota archaeon]